MLNLSSLLLLVSWMCLSSATGLGPKTGMMGPKTGMVMMGSKTLTEESESVPSAAISESEPDQVPAQWVVPVNDSDRAGQETTPITQYCLLAAANITVTVIRPDKNVTITVPANARTRGECETTSEDNVSEGREEIWLDWPDSTLMSVDKLNLTISRSGRLASLYSARTSLTVSGSRLELTTHLQPHDYIVPTWPLRYGLTCQQVINFPLYTVVDNSVKLNQSEDVTNTPTQPPVAFLRIEDLKLEAFRLDDEYPGSTDNYYSRYNWECEFHKRSDWAPIVVSCGLAGLVVFALLAYALRKKMGCVRVGDYQQV